MNIPGRYLKQMPVWRKIAMHTWSTPDNPTVHGLLDIDVGNLQEYLKRRSEETGVKCTITHAVARGLALLLRRYPECNALVRRRKIWLRDDVDIFLQVAMPIDDKAGKADLSGATIRHADEKPVHQIARELRDQAAAVREKRDGQMAKTRGMIGWLPGFLLRWMLKIISWLSYTLNLRVPTTPRDAFGSAMVTSVASFGVKLAYVPIVTFSRCPLIVVVNQVEDRAVVRDGEIVIRPMISLTATMDHRVLDGFQAGRLARLMTEVLENPELLDEEARPPEEGAA